MSRGSFLKILPAGSLLVIAIAATLAWSAPPDIPGENPFRALDEHGVWIASALTHNPPPGPLIQHTMVYSPNHGPVLFGGLLGYTTTVNTVWTHAGLVPLGTPPLPRSYHVAILDAAGTQMIVHGGRAANGTILSDIWSLSMSDGQWKVLLGPGDAPTRMGHSAILDPVRERMVCFGGRDGTSYYNDVWAFYWATGEIEDLTPAISGPSPRMEATAIYDPVGDRMIVYGGEGTFTFNDLWALSLSGKPAWTLLTPTGTPPSGSSSGHTAIYDSNRQRMVVVPAGNPEVVSLSLIGSPAWSHLQPTGDIPPYLSWHAAAYDPVGDRMFVQGGTSTPTLRQLLWGPGEVSVPDVPAIFSLSPARPNPTAGPVAFDLELLEAAVVRGVVLDPQGRVVGKLAGGETAASRHRLQWDGRTAAGSPAKPGVYFAKVAWPGGNAVRRLAIVR